uniref:uncharacterized protein isoform X2 n=1 Tax=Myxine glutinosa TaxID=7769 RepID=UPI00358ED926
MRIASDLYGMTLTRRSLDLVFMITMLWIFTIHLCRAEDVIVSAERGRSVTLPCTYRGGGNVIVVKWSRSHSVLVEYFGEPLKATIITNSTDIKVGNEEDQNDFSIIIRRVETHHDGNFTCWIIAKGKEVIEKTIRLTVTVLAVLKLEVFPNLKAGYKVVPVACCTAENSRPPASITWNSSLNGECFNETTTKRTEDLSTTRSCYRANLSMESNGTAVVCIVQQPEMSRQMKEHILFIQILAVLKLEVFPNLKAGYKVVPVACCTAENSRPPASITWNSSLNGECFNKTTTKRTEDLSTTRSCYRANLSMESNGKAVVCIVQQPEMSRQMKEHILFIQILAVLKLEVFPNLKAGYKVVPVACCMAENSRPPASITWNSSLNGECFNETTTKRTEDLSTTRSCYRANLSMESNGMAVVCIVQQPEMSRQMKEHILFIQILAVLKLEVFPNLKAGYKVVPVACCTAENSRPPASITWNSSLNGECFNKTTTKRTEDLSTTRSCYRANLSMESNGTAVVCIVQQPEMSRQMKEHILFIQILAVLKLEVFPNLKAGYKVVPVACCTAENSRPPASITWNSSLNGKCFNKTTTKRTEDLSTTRSCYRANLSMESNGTAVVCIVQQPEMSRQMKEHILFIQILAVLKLEVFPNLKAGYKVVPVACCTAENSRPPASITWNSSLNGECFNKTTTKRTEDLSTTRSCYRANLSMESNGKAVVCIVQQPEMSRQMKEHILFIQNGKSTSKERLDKQELIMYLGIALGSLLFLLLLTALILFKMRRLSYPCCCRKCNGNEDCDELSVTYAAVNVRGRGSEEASNVVSKSEEPTEYAEICSKKPTLA